MRIRHFAALGSLALIAAASVYGQRLTADIPFEFQVGKAVLPAGHYNVERAYANTQGLLSIGCSDCKTTRTIILSNGMTIMERRPEAKLVFHKYGNTYFLYQVISFGGPGGGSELSKSTTERELALNTPKTEAGLVILALR